MHQLATMLLAHHLLEALKSEHMMSLSQQFLWQAKDPRTCRCDEENTEENPTLPVPQIAVL